MPGKPWILLNYAFRPFFLFSTLYAVAAIVLWITALRGVLWSPPGPDPVMWHAHEMLFGFALGAAAGFLLSAVATWTNRPQICGTPLGVLAAAWLMGRAAMLGAAALPDGLVALADLSFPVLFAAFATREIFGGRSQRNYPIALVIAGIAVLDLIFHLGRSGIWPAADRVAIILAVHVFLTLIAIIGGRIVPTFTTNWLRLRGATDMPLVRPSLERTVLPVMLIAGLADSLTVVGLPAAAAGALSIAVAAVHAIRLSGWRGTATTAEPLLAVLHVGYAWIPIGYLLLGLVGLGLPLPKPAVFHTLTMGGIGAVILAVLTRVALGHTARPLTATPLTTTAYVFLNTAVLIRIISAFAPASAYQILIDVAATGWMIAFALYLWVYSPMLLQPRTDGRPERRTAT